MFKAAFGRAERGAWKILVLHCTGHCGMGAEAPKSVGKALSPWVWFCVEPLAAKEWGESTDKNRSHGQQLRGEELEIAGKTPVGFGVVMFAIYRNNSSGIWGGDVWDLQEKLQWSFLWWRLGFTAETPVELQVIMAGI